VTHIAAAAIRLAVLALAAAPALAADDAVFDPPLQRADMPDVSDGVRCTWYHGFAVRETGVASPAPGPASLLRATGAATAPCGPASPAGATILDTAGYSFLGRKGGFLFFQATDPNGAIPFRILDAASGRVLYADATAPDHGIPRMVPQDAGLRLTYTRGVNTPCSLLRDPASCWSRLLHAGVIPRGMARPSPLVCAAAYAAGKAPADDPSLLGYDIDLTLDAGGRVHVLSRSAIACTPMP
jgi:hypothetical protein